MPIRVTLADSWALAAVNDQAAESGQVSLISKNPRSRWTLREPYTENSKRDHC
jgi:hypothetical protein